MEYSELKRSISQYMDSIVCAQDTPAAEKMRRLRKERFDGRVGEGLEVLGQLCAEDEAALNELDGQIEALDQQIEKENQLIGNIHKIRQQQEELSRNQEALAQLEPQMQQIAEQYHEAERNAAEGEQLAVGIRKQQENLALFDRLQQEQEALAGIKRTISQETIHKQELEEHRCLLETSLQADSEGLKKLSGAGEEKARLENNKDKINLQIGSLHQQQSGWEREITRQKEKEQSISREQEETAQLAAGIAQLQEQIAQLSDREEMLGETEDLQEDSRSRRNLCRRCRHSRRKIRTGCGSLQIPLRNCRGMRQRLVRRSHSAERRSSI